MSISRAKGLELTCPEVMSWPVRNIQFGQRERWPGVLRWGWVTRKRLRNVALPLRRPVQLLCREAKSGSPTHICPLNGRLRQIQTYCPNHTIMSRLNNFWHIKKSVDLYGETSKCYKLTVLWCTLSRGTFIISPSPNAVPIIHGSKQILQETNTLLSN